MSRFENLLDLLRVRHPHEAALRSSIAFFFVISALIVISRLQSPESVPLNQENQIDPLVLMTYARVLADHPANIIDFPDTLRSDPTCQGTFTVDIFNSPPHSIFYEDIKKAFDEHLALVESKQLKPGTLPILWTKIDLYSHHHILDIEHILDVLETYNSRSVTEVTMRVDCSVLQEVHSSQVDIDLNIPDHTPVVISKSFGSSFHTETGIAEGRRTYALYYPGNVVYIVETINNSPNQQISMTYKTSGENPKSINGDIFQSIDACLQLNSTDENTYQTPQELAAEHQN